MISWMDCRIVAFDTETTGLFAYDGDRIIEFGAVEFFVNADFEITRVKHHQFMVNPEMDIPREATHVSGITNQDVAKAPVFSKVSTKIRNLLSDAILIAHNFSFDFGFLRAEFARCNLFWPKTRAEIDTLPLTRRKMTHLRSRRLEMVAKELGVSLDNAHRACDDAEACGRVFIEIAKRYQAPESLEEMIAWAVAVGPPPDSDHIAIVERGVPEFIDGPHKGKTVEEQPDYLQWMTLAKTRVEGKWRHLYPESLRSWAAQWLRARTSGPAAVAPRGGSARDWNLDPVDWRS